MDVLLSLDRDSVMAVTKSTNEHILAFSYVDGAVVTKWVLRDADKNITDIHELPYLERLMVGVNLLEQDDGRIKVTFSIPVAMDDRELFFCQLPQGFIQRYGIVFNDSEGRGPCYIKEVFVDFNESVSFCRCVVLSSGQEFIEKVLVNLGLLKNFT